MDGARAEQVLERANIFVNKNTVPGDKSAFVPSGMCVCVCVFVFVSVCVCVFVCLCL